jgi:LacI family transcriptional regulator
VEMESLNTLIQRRVDGLLLAPAASNNELLVRTLCRAAIPVVFFDRPIYNSSVRGVLSSNYGGAKEATRHLIGHGYKRILCLGIKGEDSLYTHHKRILGYRHAMQAAKLSPNIDLSITTYESAELVIKKHLYGANPPDAIFSLKHRVTIYAYKSLQKLRIKIPEKVALIGFDDFELASALQPPITVVEQQSERMARTAAELLFEDLMQKQRAKTKTTKAGGRSSIIQLETKLIVRSSCGCRTPNPQEML